MDLCCFWRKGDRILPRANYQILGAFHNDRHWFGGTVPMSDVKLLGSGLQSELLWWSERRLGTCLAMLLWVGIIFAGRGTAFF
jgi:hypothetical protein